MSYKGLSLIQTVFIAIAGISVFDYGFSELGTNDGIMINQILFSADGLIGNILQDITFWGMPQFWGYCFIIVAICQLIKSLTVNID